MAGIRVSIRGVVNMRVIQVDPTTNIVIAVKILKDNYDLYENEYETNLGNLGQIRQFDGTFIDRVPELDEIKSSKITQLNKMYQETLEKGFNVTVGGASYVCGATADDRGTMSATQDAINNGYVAFPFDYADIYGGKITLNSQADFDTIKQAMAKFGFAQHQQILNLIAEVRTQTTNANGEVDNIQWTVAAY
jgi:hypothetical protein